MDDETMIALKEDIVARLIRSPHALQGVLAEHYFHIVYVLKGCLTIKSNTILSLEAKTITWIENGLYDVRANELRSLRCFVISFSSNFFKHEGLRFKHLKFQVTPVHFGGGRYDPAPAEHRVIVILLEGLFISYSATHEITSDFLVYLIGLLSGKFSERLEGCLRNAISLLTPKGQLARRFIDLVELRCTESHEVCYYADKLCITRGHLTRIMKETSNKTPKFYISEALISRSKTLLLDGYATITSVSDSLGFSSTASFSTFFKKHMGKTPSAYRKSYLKT
ncbi:helix-turn-helix domain-containing protein [Flavobacterium beibuense]|nr:AraC family transcriptional regulator [Flavobacterium beibuense]